MSFPRNNLLESLLSIDPIGTYLFENGMGQEERQLVSRVNNEWYSFYENNIHRTLSSQIVDMAERRYLAGSLKDIPRGILYTLHQFYKNTFPTIAKKREFVAFFRRPEVLKITNVAFWQLVISRLLDMMGIAEPVKKQFVSYENLAIFKKLMIKLSQFNAFGSLTEEMLAAHPLGLTQQFDLFVEVKNVVEVFANASLEELMHGMKTYYLECYQPNLNIGDETHGSLRDKAFLNELGDIVESFDRDILNALKKLYTEDKKTARWAMSILKKMPGDLRELLKNEFFKNGFFDEEEDGFDNRLQLVGVIYALSRFEGKFDQVVQKIDFLSDDDKHERINEIKTAVMIEAAKQKNIVWIDDLIAKLSNPDFFQFILNVIRDDDSSDDTIVVLFKRTRYWSSSAIDRTKFDYTIMMNTLFDRHYANPENVAYAFRPSSLLWKMDQTFLMNFMYRSVGKALCVDDKLLLTLSENQEEINRLHRLGVHAAWWNQISNKKYNKELSNLFYIMKLPNCLFDVFAGLKLGHLNKSGVTQYYIELKKANQLIHLYEKIINEYSGDTDFFRLIDLIKNLLADCTMDKMSILLTGQISLVENQNMHHSFIYCLLRMLSLNNTSPDEETIALVKFIIENAENEELFSLVERVYQANNNDMGAFRDALVVELRADESNEDASLEASEDTERNPKRKKEDSDEDYKPSSGEISQSKKPRRK